MGNCTLKTKTKSHLNVVTEGSKMLNIDFNKLNETPLETYYTQNHLPFFFTDRCNDHSPECCVSNRGREFVYTESTALLTALDWIRWDWNSIR